MEPQETPELTMLTSMAERCVQVVYRLKDGRLRDCPYFLKNAVADWEGIENYFKRQHSISLHASMLLPGTIYGLTLKQVKSVGKRGKTARRHRYYIIINGRLAKAGFRRLFVTMHELGHAFLHSRLLREDQAFASHASDARSGRTIYDAYAEIEANIFSLVLLLPDSLLEEAGEPSPERLQESYEKKTGLSLDFGLARDRVTAYEIFHGRKRTAASWYRILPTSSNGG